MYLKDIQNLVCGLIPNDEDGKKENYQKHSFNYLRKLVSIGTH